MVIFQALHSVAFFQSYDPLDHIGHRPVAAGHGRKLLALVERFGHQRGFVADPTRGLLVLHPAGNHGRAAVDRLTQPSSLADLVAAIDEIPKLPLRDRVGRVSGGHAMVAGSRGEPAGTCRCAGIAEIFSARVELCGDGISLRLASCQTTLEVQMARASLSGTWPWLLVQRAATSKARRIVVPKLSPRGPHS